MQVNITGPGMRALLGVTVPLAIHYTVQLSGYQLTTCEKIATFLPIIGLWAARYQYQRTPEKTRVIVGSSMLSALIMLRVFNEPDRNTFACMLTLSSTFAYAVLQKYISWFSFEVVQRNPLHEEIPNLNQ